MKRSARQRPAPFTPVAVPPVDALAWRAVDGSLRLELHLARERTRIVLVPDPYGRVSYEQLLRALAWIKYVTGRPCSLERLSYSSAELAHALGQPLAVIGRWWTDPAAVPLGQQLYLAALLELRNPQLAGVARALHERAHRAIAEQVAGLRERMLPDVGDATLARLVQHHPSALQAAIERVHLTRAPADAPAALVAAVRAIIATDPDLATSR